MQTVATLIQALVTALALGCTASTVRYPAVTGEPCAGGDDACRDADADGVRDTGDLCPDDAEDMDGFEDDDGCPDPDNDRDRILDVDDHCPEDKEVYNGTDDEDGCPDVGRVVVTAHPGGIQARVFFTSGSAAVPPRSMPIIEAVAATLDGDPEINVAACVGRADKREPNPRALSEARARAVCDELVKLGVERGRLVSHGMGRGDASPGLTAQARSRDRNVDFLPMVRRGLQQNVWTGRRMERVERAP